jgi:hypothetical protein
MTLDLARCEGCEGSEASTEGAYRFDEHKVICEEN